MYDLSVRAFSHSSSTAAREHAEPWRRTSEHAHSNTWIKLMHAHAHIRLFAFLDLRLNSTGIFYKLVQLQLPRLARWSVSRLAVQTDPTNGLQMQSLKLPSGGQGSIVQISRCGRSVSEHRTFAMPANHPTRVVCKSSDV